MLYDLDIRATAWINGLSGFSPLDTFFSIFTNLGVPLLVLAVVLSWWIGGDRQQERHRAVLCGLSFLLALALNQLILLAVHRVRPYDAGITHLLIAPSADPSFPSDHASASFAIVFAYLFATGYRKAFCFLPIALLLVFSRIYIGTHYLGDVLGGIGTALLAAVIVRGSYREGTRFDRWVTTLL